MKTSRRHAAICLYAAARWFYARMPALCACHDQHAVKERGAKNMTSVRCGRLLRSFVLSSPLRCRHATDVISPMMPRIIGEWSRMVSKVGWNGSRRCHQRVRQEVRRREYAICCVIMSSGFDAREARVNKPLAVTECDDGAYVSARICAASACARHAPRY